MKLCYNAGIFYAVCDFAEKDIVKDSGFRWFPEKKYEGVRCWWTEDASAAIGLREYSENPSLCGYLEGLMRGRNRTVELSRATNSLLEIPSPTGMIYNDYQRAGIEYALQWSNTLLADEQGLGKTLEAIGLINYSHEIQSTLIICPANLKLNWRDELRKWLTRSQTVGIVEPKGKLPATDIVIINYDIVHRFTKELSKRHWDLQIADECQKIKNPKAQRTQAVTSLLSDRALFLTGTPIPNRVEELWPILRRLDPLTWANFFNFAKQYCAAKKNDFGWDFSGSSNLPDLQKKLRETVMVRRLKKNVLQELPAKRRQIIPLSADKFGAIIKQEQFVLGEYRQQLEDLEVAALLAKASDDADNYKQAVAELREGLSAEFGKMAEIRHMTALAKVPYIIEHVETLLEGTDKVVLFAHHRDALDQYADAFKKHGSVLVKGGMTGAKQHEAVQLFQTNKDIRVFVGGITTAQGYNLFASDTVVCAEIDWVPATISQAEDRCHRIGQHNSVLVQHIVVDGSIEANMAMAVVAKQEAIDAALDNDEEVVVELDEPVTLREKTVQVLRAKILRQAKTLSPEDCRSVKNNLHETLNQRGNHIPIVERRVLGILATYNTLTPRQAALVKALFGM